MAKSYLDELGVPYEEINVAADRDAAAQLVEKTGQMAVPVIEIGSKIIIGFDRDSIKEAAGK